MLNSANQTLRFDEPQSHRRNTFAHFTFLLLIAALSFPQFAFCQPQENERKNPIGEFFRGLDRGIKEEADDINRAKLGRDQLDTRPPQDPDLTRKLEQARLFLDQERWHDAVDVLQFLLQIGDDAFYFDTRHELHSIKSEAEKLLANLPDAAQRNDLNRYQPIAQSEYDSAIAAQSDESLARVAENYFRTTPGERALLAFAICCRDRGQLRTAAHAFSRLANASESADARLRFSRLAITVAHESGDSDLLEHLMTKYATNMDIVDLQSIPAITRSSGLDETQRPFEVFPRSIDESVDPVVIPNWSMPMIERFAIRDFADQLLISHSKHWATLPTYLPVIVDGKLIVRTLRSLQVRDFHSGELVWENRSTNNFEALLDEKLDGALRSFNSRQTTDQNPLSNLILRDQVTRSMSSDGQQVFVIEGNELLAERPRTYSWRRRPNDDADADQWRTNELVSYDIRSGRRRWRLGGPVNELPFSRQLAGTYFFGPPTVSGSELFVVGETDGEVALHVIDPRTGEPIWSQVIAIPSTDVTNDVVRRLWTCQPAISGHLVICPTTTGWLVAVDRVTKRLAWTVRYGARQPNGRRPRGGNPVQSLQSLNFRWAFPTPICVGQYVLFTPPELPDEFGNQSESCICVNIYSGEVEWREENRRENQLPNLYLAGVDGDHAIFVGKNSVTARKISGRGRAVWSSPTRLTTDGEFVSGRGVMLNRSLLLPVGGSRIVEVDLDSGEQVRSFTVPGDGPMLGNLIYSAGYLVATSYRQLAIFPINPSIPTQSERSESLVSKVSQIEECLAEGTPLEALDLIRALRQSPEYAAASKSELHQIQQLYWTTLKTIAATRIDKSSVDALTEMSSMDMSPEQRLTFRQLVIDSKLNGGEWEESLKLCLDLLHQTDNSQTLRLDERTISVDSWIASRLRDIAEEYTSSAVEESIRRQHPTLIDEFGQRRVARILTALPMGQNLQYELGEQAYREHSLSEAIVRFQRVASSQDEELATRAWIEMATIFESIEAWDDAKNCWEQMKHRSLSSSEGTGKIELDQRIEAVEHRRGTATAPSAFTGSEHWETFRSGSRRHNEQVKVVTGEGELFTSLQNRRFLFYRQQSRVRIEDAITGELQWSFPIRRAPHLRRYSIIGMLQSGAMTYLVNQGVLHALMNFDNQIAWTFTPDLWGEAASQLRRPIARTNFEVADPQKFLSMNSLQTYQTPAGMVVSASPHGVLVFDDRLRALDPLTGELLWSSTQFDSRINAIPIEDRFLIFRSNDAPELIDAMDGSMVPTEWDKDFSVATLQVDGTERISFEEKPEQGPRIWELQRSDIFSGAVVWSHLIDRNSRLARIDRHLLLLLTAEGTLSTIDLENGTRTVLAEIDSKMMEEADGAYYFSDAERIYLLLAHGSVTSSRLNLGSLRTPGTLLTCDRDGGLLWSLDSGTLDEKPNNEQDSDNDEPPQSRNSRASRKVMQLVTEEVEASPLIFFANNDHEFRKTLRLSKLRLIGIDKKTGRQVVNWDRLSNSGGFTYLHVDPSSRAIDLWTQSERLQIQQLDSPSKQSEPAE